MARSFLAGSISGGILGLGMATVASVLAPPPQPPQVAPDAPGAEAAPQEAATAHDTSTERDTSPQSEAGAGPAAAPDPDTLAALTDDTQAPGTVPQTGSAGELSDPSAPAEDAQVTLEGDEPVLPNPLALAPMSPQPADDLSISTEPAQPPVPQESAPQSAFDEDTQAAVEAAKETAEAAPTAPAPQVAQTGPQAPTAPQAEAETGLATPSEDSQTAEAAPAPITPAAPAEEVPQAQQDTPPAAPSPQVAEADQTPETAPAEEPPQGRDEATLVPDDTEEPAQVAALSPSARPQIGTPGIALTERNSGIAIRRPGAETLIPASDTSAPEVPPITRYAQAFDNPEAKPLMSIVLIDTGASHTSGEAGLAALDSFPAAISFAVDASLPDAVDRMALYRASGFEVLAMVDLPEGAQASDAETTLNVVLSQLPEVVGVLEGTQTGLQANREAADQVSAILASSGHGLLTQNRGLNTMPKLARKAGVPAAPIFRDFDSKGQTATVIRRFLDQAAFKAGQEGAVIMLGRMQPETITALLLWGLQDRAGQVAIAPVSAVLTREGG